MRIPKPPTIKSMPDRGSGTSAIRPLAAAKASIAAKSLAGSDTSAPLACLPKFAVRRVKSLPLTTPS